jgi:hypothetical protein
MQQFDAPGFLTDFNAQQLSAWSNWISDTIDEATKGDPGGTINDAPRPRFFNALHDAPAVDAVEKDITWTAFPRIVQIDSATDEERWQTADGSRSVQDEYCEWSVTRDPQSRKITRVTFTSEGPEYWTFLAAVNFPKVVELYQQHVNPKVQPQDLQDARGNYDPHNKWNNSAQRGAMHLIQRNNTLSAEIELAAGASNVRVINGQILTGERELIKCARYGEVERHSDPTIGATVNELARQDADITLANPVGLCIASLSTMDWETPDGSAPIDYWTITRGTKDKALRAVFEVPSARQFFVGDIKINGQKIRYGAQIADCIKIKLTGLATHIGQSRHNPITDCKKAKPQVNLAMEDISVADLLNATAKSHR